MPAPGPFNSKNIPPIPATDAPYGGSEQQPVNFWSSALPADDIVCSVDFSNVTDSCCPYAIGITDEEVLGCRMKNTTENVAFFEACSKQIWGEVTKRPQDSIPSCVPFQDKLKNLEEVRVTDFQNAATDQMVCGTIGSLDLNYTGKCCDQLGGRIITRQSVTDQSDPRYYAKDCELNPDQQGKWNECISASEAYPACARGKGADGGNKDDSGAPALRPRVADLGTSALVAAAALAFLA